MPLRAAAYACGLDVEWEASTGNIYLTPSNNVTTSFDKVSGTASSKSISSVFNSSGIYLYNADTGEHDLVVSSGENITLSHGAVRPFSILYNNSTFLNKAFASTVDIYNEELDASRQAYFAPLMAEAKALVDAYPDEATYRS